MRISSTLFLYLKPIILIYISRNLPITGIYATILSVILQIRLRDDRHDILDDGDCCLHALHADMLIRTVEAVAAGAKIRAPEDP